MISIGIRELRQRASEYLRLVRDGETVEITDRGRGVALLVPPVTGTPLEAAATFDHGVLRSLDAIHLSAAALLGNSPEAVVTYDRRLAEAAGNSGVPVAAPA